MKQSTVVDNAEANIKDAFNKEHSTSNPNKVTLNSRHRKSNLNLDKPDLEFLQSQLDSCRGIIAQREAELKKVKESDSLKAKRIMQLDAQLQEARNLINKSSQSTETGAQIPKADEPTNDNNNKQRHSNEDVKIILLEAKTNTLEHQMTSMSSKLDSLQAMLFVKDNIKEKSGSCQCPGPENKTETPKDDEDDSSPSTEDKSNAESELDIESPTEDELSTNVNNNQTETDLNNEFSKNNENTSEELRLRCQQCEFVTENRISFNIHMVSHFSSNISCDKCSYCAIHEKDLGRHMKNMHASPKHLSCKLCDFYTVEESEFKEHCRQAHNNETRIFSRSMNVTNKCHLCSYHPTNRNDLRRHIQSMHGKTLSEKNSSTKDQVSSACKVIKDSPSKQPESSSSSSEMEFHCPGGCTPLVKSFVHKEELELHLSYFHASQ